MAELQQLCLFYVKENNLLSQHTLFILLSFQVKTLRKSLIDYCSNFQMVSLLHIWVYPHNVHVFPSMTAISVIINKFSSMLVYHTRILSKDIGVEVEVKKEKKCSLTFVFIQNSSKLGIFKPFF